MASRTYKTRKVLLELYNYQITVGENDKMCKKLSYYQHLCIFLPVCDCPVAQKANHHSFSQNVHYWKLLWKKFEWQCGLYYTLSIWNMSTGTVVLSIKKSQLWCSNLIILILTKRIFVHSTNKSPFYPWTSLLVAVADNGTGLYRMPCWAIQYSKLNCPLGSISSLNGFSDSSIWLRFFKPSFTMVINCNKRLQMEPFTQPR